MGEQQSADPRIGSVIHGRYQILRLVAEGAMGAVYEGVRLRIGRPVAVKFLHRAYAKSEDSQRRFEREAVAMSKLSHPNCVSVIDFGVDGGPYIVMDLVHGQTLRELIDGGELPPLRCLKITAQMLAGLGHAHDNGLVHRDIKPANVKVESDDGENDYVRVLDFGLAKLTDPGADQLTEEGIVAGTTTYMSPEHAFGAGIDARSDLYSAGLVLFELLTGRPPFESETAAGMLLKHRDQPPPRLSEVREDVPFSEALEQVVARALAKEKDARFQSADAFIAALAELPEAQGASSLSALSSRLPTRSETRRVSWAPARLQPAWRSLWQPSRRVRLAAVGALTLLGLGGLAVPLWAHRAASDAEPRPSAPGPMSQPPPVEPAEAPAPPARAPADPAAAARAEDLLMRGEAEAARVKLEQLLALEPENAELHYLAGTAYFECRRWADGLSAYAAAIHYDPDYKSRPLLNRNAIRALRNLRTRDQAHDLIVDQLRASALPHLRDYLERTHDEVARRSAQQLIDELSPDAGVAHVAAESSMQ